MSFPTVSPESRKKDKKPSNLAHASIILFFLTSLSIQLFSQGEKESTIESIYFIATFLYDVKPRLLEKSDQSIDLEEATTHGFTLDERWLKSTTEEIVYQLESGNFPQDMRKETVDDVLQLLEDEKERERVLKAIYSRLRGLLLGSLLYYMDRYPEEDIDLPFFHLLIKLGISMRDLIT